MLENIRKLLLMLILFAHEVLIAFLTMLLSQPQTCPFPELCPGTSDPVLVVNLVGNGAHVVITYL